METQWNDAQIRFGQYDSTIKITSDGDDRGFKNNSNCHDEGIVVEVEELTHTTDSGSDQGEEKYGYGANAVDFTADEETFTFQFQVDLINKCVDYDPDNNNNDDEEKKDVDEKEEQHTTLDLSIRLKGFHQHSNITYCSTGLTMWPAAEKLCDHLVKNPMFIQGKRILELGSGLGLCGLLAHQMTYSHKHLNSSHENRVQGCASVHLTDGDTDALSQLRQNISANHLFGTDDEVDAHDNENGPLLSCDQLLWSRNNAEHFLQNNSNGEQYDIILASDIIYAQSVVEPMWETVKVLLKEDGYFLFAFARRQVAVTLQDILEVGESEGFEYDVCEETDPNQHLFVYRFKRKQ